MATPVTSNEMPQLQAKDVVVDVPALAVPAAAGPKAKRAGRKAKQDPPAVEGEDTGLTAPRETKEDAPPKKRQKKVKAGEMQSNPAAGTAKVVVAQGALKDRMKALINDLHQEMGSAFSVNALEAAYYEKAYQDWSDYVLKGNTRAGKNNRKIPKAIDLGS